MASSECERCRLCGVDGTESPQAMEEREVEGDVTVLQGDAGLLKTRVWLGGFV